LMPNLIPFDPNKHEPVDLGLGGLSTEYLASEYAPNNGVWNIPTIWFNSETNQAVLLDIDEAWEISRAYELSTGNMFPRFNNLPDAVAAAKERSNAGGATDVPLMSDGYHEMPDGSMMKDSEMSSEPATEGEY
jgi:hypothetical protein